MSETEQSSVSAREEHGWTLDPRLHRSMFVGDVHGGTLVFRRSIWAGGILYPEVNLAEDAILMQQATARGRRPNGFTPDRLDAYAVAASQLSG